MYRNLERVYFYIHEELHLYVIYVHLYIHIYMGHIKLNVFLTLHNHNIYLSNE